MSLVSTASIKDTPTRLAIQKLADKLDEDKAPTFAGMTFTGKVTAGSFGSPIDVTSTRKYGFELHFSGNDYDVTGLRSRASLITTADSSTRTACGALLQAANSDGISVSVLNGALIEAMGKSTATAATISTMRGLLINTEWSAKDTVTDLRVLHVRTHTRDNATEGYFSNSGYGVYIENEAVGGNGQALDAGIYFKGTNLSAGNKAFTYGIDFSGSTFATAEIRFSNGETIDNLTDGQLDITGDLVVSGTLIGYLKYDTFAGDVYTLDTAGITLTLGTLTAEQITSTDDITAIDGKITARAGFFGVPGSAGQIWLLDDTSGNWLKIEAADNQYSANRTLSIDLDNADRLLTISGDATISQDYSTTGSPTFAGVTSGSYAIDATIDHTFTDSSDDLVISNLNQDKDIIFSVNDGGTQKSFITIDSSKPALMLDPGTIPAILGLIDCAGTFTTGLSYVLNFHPVYSGTGGISGINIDIDLTGTAGAVAQGLWVTGNTNASQASGTQTLYGVKLEPDLKNSAGTSVAYGTYFKPAQVILTNATTRHVYGNYIETPITAATAGTVNQYGVYLQGWGSINEVGGTINSYAIYSDGGQSVHAGNLRIGDTTAPGSTLEVNGDCQLGDGGTTNYAQFAADGELTLAGTARVLKEIIIGSIDFHKGSSAPDDGYINAIVHTLDFDKTTTQHGHYNVLVPHDLAAGTEISMEVDWFFDAVEADHYVTWEVQYLTLADGEDPATAATTTYQKSVISTGNNDKQIHTTFGTGITGAVADDTLLMRFSRDSDGTNDTDDLDQDARLLVIHLHYISDKLGQAT